MKRQRSHAVPLSGARIPVQKVVRFVEVRDIRVQCALMCGNCSTRFADSDDLSDLVTRSVVAGLHVGTFYAIKSALGFQKLSLLL